jgi:glycosyltransferase involved in cell wall biosynthesis
MTQKKSKLTIGLPVYNRENLINKKLENILTQTFQDFKIIIYDNSNDRTGKICKEFADNDDRIQYIFEKNANGVEYAFNYVLKKAETEYFVWAASDDLWASDFLEKNVAILEKQPKVVGSIGNVKRYGGKIEEFKVELLDSFWKKHYKKIRKSFRQFDHVSIFAEAYSDRATKFLRIHEELSIYAVFRTKPLQESFVFGPHLWKKIILNVLRFGNFNVTNETEWFWHTGSSGIDNPINQFKKNQMRIGDLLFPYYDYILWCAKNIGKKFVIKNLDFFVFSTLMYYTILIYHLFKNKKNF